MGKEIKNSIVDIDELCKSHLTNAEISKAMKILDKFRCPKFEILEYYITPETDNVSIFGEKEDLDGLKRQFGINISLNTAKHIINEILESNGEENN